MESDFLLKAALISSILGLLALMIIGLYEPGDDDAILLKEEGDVATVKGEVVRVTSKEKVTFIDLDIHERLNIVAFGNVSARKGDFLEVEGEVRLYEGKKELVADRLSLKSKI